MTFGQPAYLWLLLAIAVLAGFCFWLTRRIRLQHASIGAGQSTLTSRVGITRERARTIFLWTGLVAVALALASPRWGSSEGERESTGADLLLAVDCSRSMLATDLYPDRMEAARRKAIDLLALSPETRMALLPFAGTAVLRCPLTGDHNALETMLQDCTPELFPGDFQGTAIGDAVNEGLKLLGRQVERGQAILVLSDGADDDAKSVEEAAKRAKDAGIIVYGLFLGDSEREVTVDIDGRKEVMKAARDSLDQLANATGGISVNATSDKADVTVLHDHITSHVAQTPWKERRRIVQSERYQWPLLAAIALIAIGALLPTRRRRVQQVMMVSAEAA